MEKTERVKEIFLKYVNKDTDWSMAADKFVSWCVENDFQNESFSSFVEWLDDDQIDDVWTFFFGYGDEFEKFADDWVDDEERKDYLQFAREDE